MFFLIGDSSLFRIILTALFYYCPISAVVIIQTHTPSARIAEQVAFVVKIVSWLVSNFKFQTNPLWPPSLGLLVPIALALRHARMGRRPSSLFAVSALYF